MMAMMTLQTVLLLLLYLLIVAQQTTALSSKIPSQKQQQQQLAANWFSISKHLQNPTLYDAEWANSCHCHYYETENRKVLLTSKNVQEGDILSLLPIHGVGLKNEGNANNNDDWMVYDPDDDDLASSVPSQSPNKRNNKNKKKRMKSSNKSTPPSPLRYDISEFLEVPQTTQHAPPIEIVNSMYCHVHPNRPIRNGWMGHLATTTTTTTHPHSQTTHHSPKEEAQTEKESSPSTKAATSTAMDVSNCCILALAPPICALFATKDMQAGTPLILQTNKDPRTTEFFFNYRDEIEELQNYMDMAYPPKETSNKEVEPTNDNNHKKKMKKDKHKFQHAFYQFPRNYPNLQTLYKNPDILAIPNFLSPRECQSLMDMAQPQLVPCLTKNPTTGQVEADPSRTSQNANIPQAHVPFIVNKLTTLANCTADHLEILQVLKYAPGQFFQPHTDGFSGPVTACGFYDSARLVTIFCYLNSVAKGGATRFGDLNLDIAPQQGLAVVHFPTTLGFEEDVRTQHEGVAAIDEKWLLVTWVWMHPRNQRSIYAEKWLDAATTS